MKSLLYPLFAGFCVSIASGADELLMPSSGEVATSQASSLPFKERLQQLELTFQKNAAAQHRALLLEYLERLQALRARIETLGSMTELSLVNLEIAETETRLAKQQSFGFEYQRPQARPTGALRVDVPEPKLVLNAEQAKGVASGAATVSVGSAQWRLNGLPAGTYHLSVIYVAPSNAMPIQWRWTLGGQSGSVALTPPHAEPATSPFLSQDLGQVSLPSGSSEALELVLENASPFGAPIHVRHVVLSQAPTP